jgi:putative hydrolase of the HAD superfamily
MTLEPERYEPARLAAIEELQHHPELEHDEEIWSAFTRRIVQGMGGAGDAALRCAVEITRAWEVHSNFELYEDALPVLEELRRHGLKLGLVSNTSRDIAEFVAHHRLDVDAAIASGAHGYTKPHRSIFDAVLASLEVEPERAAMVGDSPQDDIEGARALGMRAFLVDRDGRHPRGEDTLPDLFALPAALGLRRPG